MKLPQEFIERMQAILGEEFEDFSNSYNHSRFYGLRVNTLKLSVESFIELTGKPLEKIPWSTDGFYYSQDESPGKHPYYYAGLYYIQEPSAMAPAEILSACPGEKVHDLCAAPGGKTMQIAAAMRGKGVLVANEISETRVKALVKNIELCGVKNAIVTNETPQRLSARFRSYFDRILVDAPCSGEGMMRKDDNARRSWQVYNSARCSVLQSEILEEADAMLKPGGRLVYSTCTFSHEENESVLGKFLDRHKNYELIEIDKHSGISPGLDIEGVSHAFDRCARFWPHKVRGEGHFAAVLQKKDGSEYNNLTVTCKFDSSIYEQLNRFFEENLNIQVPEYIKVFGDNICAVGEDFPDTSGLNAVRTGWRLGTFEKGRFEPMQSLVMGLLAEDIKNVINFDLNSIEVSKYLKGETIFADCKDGLGVVCTGVFPLGWVKARDGVLKNIYPKGWRKQHE